MNDTEQGILLGFHKFSMVCT